MTPDIEAICEEMERDYLFGFAARLRAWWSPERRAFHEAAILMCNWNNNESANLEEFQARKQFDLSNLQAAYLALCESDKHMRRCRCPECDPNYNDPRNVEESE